MDLSDLTETQKNIMTILGDGYSHPQEEIRACLFDNQAGKSTIRTHIGNIRKILRPKGYEIVTEFRDGRNSYYRLVRLVSSATDGRR